MKRFFYISLIIQMATLPITFGIFFGGGGDPEMSDSDPVGEAQSILSLAAMAESGASDSICDYLESDSAGAGLLDNMQQLKHVAGVLYGDEPFDDCASLVENR